MVRLKNVPAACALHCLQDSQFRRQCAKNYLQSVGHKTPPASTTTKAMRKKYGLGWPHQIGQHNGRQRHCTRVSAFAFLLPIKCLSEVNCAV
jgi:hypothetical protein